MTCPFCERMISAAPLCSNEASVAFYDAFPCSPGHTLIVPRRCEGSLLALSPDEQAAVWRLVPEVCTELLQRHQPDGFNVGVNVGPAAGQTVPHAHVHVIPRYLGDVEEPRGGVRWVLPDRAAYWKAG